MPIPTLDDPEQTEAFIAARVDEGSDWIKVVYEHGETSGRPVPTLDPSTLPRIVAAARVHNKLAVFHVSTAREALEAIAAGADGLVHVWHARVDAGEAGGGRGAGRNLSSSSSPPSPLPRASWTWGAGPS